MMNITNMRIKPKMIAIFLLIGVLPVIGSALFSAYLSTQSLIESSFSKLVAIQSMKKDALEGQFQTYINDIKTVSKLPAVMEILDIENLNSGHDPKRLSAILQKDSNFFDSYLLEETTWLQGFLETYNYSDIYILDCSVGNIMYTVNDSKSRGKNVLTGDFKDSNLSKIWEKAVKKNDIVMSDFDVMSATDKRQMAFIACPIINVKGEREAILMVAYDVKLVTDVVEGHEDLGETGETYMIGWQEEDEHFEFRSPASLKYGANITIGSTIPALSYWWDALASDLKGGSGRYVDSVGNDVLVVYDHLDLAGLNWFLVSKIDESEVVEPLINTFYKIILFALFCSVVIVLVAVKVAKNFTKPIIEETNYANAISHGDFDGKVENDRIDEIGDLGRSLQNMSEKLFAVDWIRTKQQDLDNLLRGNQEIQTIAEDCINFFVENLSATLGVIYLNNGGTLELKASHSFDKRKGNFSSFGMGDGIVGQAALENKILFFSGISDAPAYNYGVGEKEMNALVAAPISKDGKVLAIMLLGSVEEFPELEQRFIRQNVDNIATIFKAAEAREHIAELLEQSQQQQLELKKSNDTLEEQKLDLQASESELQAQQEELRVTNDELVEQTKALQSSEKELQAQQEELRVTNEELAARSIDLQKQQSTIAAKNSELEDAKVEVERRMLEVEQASKYKSEFLSNMSHELRTPLNSILILSQLLRKNKSGNLSEKEITSAGAIHASGADLLNLINDILDLSKIEAGKIELNIETLKFDDIEDDLERLYGEMAKDKGLSFSINKGLNLPTSFVSDNQRLQQILRNLISNALKFTSKGEVKVDFDLATNSQLKGTILEGKNSLCFAVIDEGIGIPKDKHDDVFKAFQQADGSTSRTFGGTGLGLSICKQLTRMLGGFLLLESEENVGSTFSIFIPVTYEENPDVISNSISSQTNNVVQTKSAILANKVTEKSSVQPDINEFSQVFEGEDDIIDDRKNITPDSKSLLIIEDDRSFAKVLMEFGKERGFDCLIAGDGETGLHFADYYVPSAIILDVNLPGINGWQVIERLKEDRKLRHIPVHFISADDCSTDVIRMGAVGYLTKPISIEKMEETLGKLERLSSSPVRKLLVVEDDKTQQESIKELIAGDDVEIMAVGSGEKAYSLLTENNYDCLILDLGLEDMSGVDLLEKIKANESLQQIPIIIYTGRDLSRDEEYKLDNYADSIIIKGAKSAERLLDESALFLHRVEADLPESKQKMLKKVQTNESILDGITLLVVDDDMRNIFALSSILAERDIEVITARDGLEALQKLEEHGDAINGVLMDIMMPNMDGYEAMTKIREEMKLTKLPIIALTAKAMKGDKMKCIEAGANDYLAKPIDEDKLISILKVWMYR